MPLPEVLLDDDQQACVVSVPARQALALEGEGAPEGAAFQLAVGALYGVAYALKFARKTARGPDFKIGPLEAHWWAALEGREFVRAPRESWRWRLRLALPNDATGEEVEAAIRIATSRKGGKLEHSADAKRVFLEKVPAARVGRALHVGPYATEGQTLDAIDRAIARAGGEPAFSHVEIYLSDPRRTPPEQLETVLLRELR